MYYKGVHVFEGEAIAHVSETDVTITNSLGGEITLDVTPAVNEGTARAAAIRAHGVPGADVQALLEILGRSRTPNPTLVWHFSISSDDANGPTQYEVFIDAKTGALVWSYNNLQTADVLGTGNTMYAGQVQLPINFAANAYSMKSPSWNNIQTTDQKNKNNGPSTVFSNGTGVFGNYARDLTDRSTAGADAHFGMAKTLEYFKTNFGRNGIDGGGRSSYSRVHYGNRYENAFWSSSCFCMTYGDGASTFYPLVSLDVAAHEIGHGIMASEANLTYSGESGGLNESNSDIWGTIVETWVNNSLDVPDYWIGERIFRSNWSGNTFSQSRALRYMTDPGFDGRSPACWSPTLGSLDVHYSSGPSNHMFYLLSAGGASACNGANVVGIGIAKAAKIWYDAITNRMTSSTNYAGARAAALASATALYDGGSVEYNAVAAAFSAINVN